MKAEDEIYGELILGLDISSKDLAELIVDALVDGKILEAADFERGVEIATEEIWIRKLLVDGVPDAKEP